MDQNLPRLSPPLPKTAKRILIAEDDGPTRALLVDICEASGFIAVSAVDGELALTAARNGDFDLVLLDVMMPKLDGFQVLEALRADPKMHHWPVVMLTAMTDMQSKILGMELGADDYVTKPFKLNELQDRIRVNINARSYRQRLLAAEDALGQSQATDPLTGLGTYSLLRNTLNQEISQAQRTSTPLSALVFGFDDRNLETPRPQDVFDKVVVDFTSRIKAEMRGADQLFRLSHEEFVMLLPDTTLLGARIAAKRVVKAYSFTRQTAPKPCENMTLHVGGATFPHENLRSGEDLLREANMSFRMLRNQADTSIFEIPNL